MSMGLINIKNLIQAVLDANNNVTGLKGPDGTTIQSDYLFGIPFILPSSGTMGNNGALSAIVALPLAYTRCYMYFPANAIVAGSTAGWYYAVMSSTTTATVYNNTYTSGRPSEPSSPTAFVTTGPGAYTQTTGSAITAMSITIPGGSLGSSGAILLEMMGAVVNNGGSKVVEAYYGGSAVVSQSITTAYNFRYGACMRNIATNRQIGSFYLNFGGVAADWLRRTIDSTVDQALNLTLRIPTAATDYAIFESVSISVRKSSV